MRPTVLGLGVGTAVGGVVGLKARGATLVPWPTKVRDAFPGLLGGMTGTAAGLTTDLLIAAARRPQRVPTALLATAGIFAVAGAAGRVAAGRVLGGMRQNSRTLDAGFSAAPQSPLVTGSADSVVPLATLGREGARFVGSVTTDNDVQSVLGQARVAEPVRVFVGVDAAPTIAERVQLAMHELRRTGAFERSHLLIQAPAGTGYANSTPVDVLEILTRGDSAAVAVGYGLLPSFLSLNKVAEAAQTQRELLDAIVAELHDRPTRPRLLLYGESLGARVQELAVPAGLADLDAYGIAQALWVGTPGGVTADDFHARCAASSITIDRPEQIPADLTVRPRVWFLEHDGDPVVRFRPDLITQCPAWLEPGQPRGRNIPESMAWLPGITWAQVLVDVLFATNVKPGDFQSLGHDYRADLGAATTAAFALEATADQAARLEARLRELEIARAQRIEVTA
jgi:uncharacterized membrane protein